MEKKSEKKGIFHRIFKKIGMLALAFAMLFAGSLVMTACSNTPPPSEPPENPPEITNPKPDDSKGEEGNGETEEGGDDNKGDSGETDNNGDNNGDDKGGGGSGGSGETEEGGGSGDDSGNGDGNGESGEENIENLIYYQDENGETQYNIEKMIEVTFAQYNTRYLGINKYPYLFAKVDEFNNENTKFLVSRFNTETEVTQLDLLLFVTDDEGVYRLVKVEQKIDLTAFQGNKATDLETYFTGLNNRNFMPDYETIFTFVSTFMPGEDEVADAVVNLIEKYYDTKTKSYVTNPDFQYVLGFITREDRKPGDRSGVISGETEGLIGGADTILTYFLINKNGNLYLIRYTTYIGYEENYTGDTWLNNLKNKRYYENFFEEETEIFSNYTMEYSRENLPLDKATN